MSDVQFLSLWLMGMAIFMTTKVPEDMGDKLLIALIVIVSGGLGIATIV